MTRMGRRHRPFYRINAIDSRAPRDGRILEKLGHYDPIEKDPQKQVVIDLEKTKRWLEKGAIPSATVADLLSQKGIETKHAEKNRQRRERAKQTARKKNMPFTKAEKIEKQKADEEAQKKAQQADAEKTQKNQ